jgi:hypothetical protein
MSATDNNDNPDGAASALVPDQHVLATPAATRYSVPPDRPARTESSPAELLVMLTEMDGSVPLYMLGDPDSVDALILDFLPVSNGDLDVSFLPSDVRDRTRPVAGGREAMWRRGNAEAALRALAAADRLLLGLDLRTDRADIPTTADLEAAVRTAARQATYRAKEATDRTVTLRFGRQVHVRPINSGIVGEITSEAVAAYIARYQTKSTGHLGFPARHPLRRRPLAGSVRAPVPHHRHLRTPCPHARPRPRAAGTLDAHARVARARFYQVPPVLYHLRSPTPGPGRLPTAIRRRTPGPRHRAT